MLYNIWYTPSDNHNNAQKLCQVLPSTLQVHNQLYSDKFTTNKVVFKTFHDTLYYAYIYQIFNCYIVQHDAVSCDNNPRTPHPAHPRHRPPPQPALRLRLYPCPAHKTRAKMLA